MSHTAAWLFVHVCLASWQLAASTWKCPRFLAKPADDSQEERQGRGGWETSTAPIRLWTGCQHQGNKTHTASKEAAVWSEGWPDHLRLMTGEPTGQAGTFAGILFHEGQREEGAWEPEPSLPSARSFRSHPSSGARKSGAKKGGAAGTPASLPGEPPTSEPQSRTAASQEHTVLFVGAEICLLLIMQPDEQPLSLPPSNLESSCSAGTTACKRS